MRRLQLLFITRQRRTGTDRRETGTRDGWDGKKETQTRPGWLNERSAQKTWARKAGACRPSALAKWGPAPGTEHGFGFGGGSASPKQLPQSTCEALTLAGLACTESQCFLGRLRQRFWVCQPASQPASPQPASTDSTHRTNTDTAQRSTARGGQASGTQAGKGKPPDRDGQTGRGCGMIKTRPSPRPLSNPVRRHDAPNFSFAVPGPGPPRRNSARQACLPAKYLPTSLASR